MAPDLEPLPIDVALADIRAALGQSRAVVVVADPGAGKTTRVPPALLDAGRAILLQPRRAAARAIAQRIAYERGWTAGREVGWHIRFERRFDASTQLLVATEGILTARLQQDPLLSGFRTIVLDEFHERTLHADLAIALARQAMLARNDLRVVVMSATIDAERVSAFLGGCPVVRVPGRLHQVSVSYQPSVSPADATASILAETGGSVLVFQPGAAEIARTVDEIRRRVDRSVDVLPLHGGLDADDQQRALAPGSARRAIVCTNIAETSLTVPGVTGVVDAGLEKVARYDPERAIDSLTTERISQAAADQRAGRAGRLAPGVVHRLWNAHDRLRPFREPEMHRVDLTGVVLDILAWGGDPAAFEWFDRPREDAIEAAMRLLERMHAVRGRALTDVGRRMIDCPLPPRLARIVVAAGGSRLAIRACAALAEPYAMPPRAAATRSDLLLALDRWAEAPYRTRQVAAAVERQLGPAQSVAADAEGQLLRAILAGFPDRVARRRAPRSERALLSTGTGAALSSESGVREPEFFVALNLRASTRDNDPDSRIHMASAVEREWLEPTSVDVVHRMIDGSVRASEVERYDALTLAERPVAPDPGKAADLLEQADFNRPVPEADEHLLRRARFAGQPIDLHQLVRLAVVGVRSLDDVDSTRALPPDVVRAIESGAPETMAVPSGRRVRLEYGDDGSVAASVKLQELFGLAETPRIGPRREPVLLSLLAPNGRPGQVTRDLRSFWERTYPEVRKELRGRYAKHPWPEDPWRATPTARTTRRG